MLQEDAYATRYSRSLCTVRPMDIVRILCHRKSRENEEFLLEWRDSKCLDTSPPSRHQDAILSWHTLAELDDCLHFVQLYSENLGLLSQIQPPANLVRDRKRKLSDSEDTVSRDHPHAILTPAPSASHTSRSASIERSRSASVEGSGSFEPYVYNGILEKKEGRIRPVPRRINPDSEAKIVRIDARKLPTPAMLQGANTTNLPQTELAIRIKFLNLLRPVKGVQLENIVDRSTPSLNFTFISDYVYREGIYKTPTSDYEGCVKECKPNMGGNVGCEYTQKCECLEYAPVDEEALARRKPDLYEYYINNKDAASEIDTRGLPKRFPYSKPKGDPLVPQVLVSHYVKRRDMVYECNDNCKCGPRCKSRVVQKGRRVPLTIFKTVDRGWGVYCNEDLIRGEFIDTYLGEVITAEECDQREEQAGPGKDSYLFILDKCVGEQGLREEDCYIVDGQYMGNATRFINHSCEPNCCQYAISYDKNDFKLYNLAFFAVEFIPKGTELTFDYMDFDEMEEDDAIKAREEAERDPRNKDRIRCNCGSRKCRGFLWKPEIE